MASQHIRVLSSRSVNLNTLFQSRLSLSSQPVFVQILLSETDNLNQWMGENDCRKYSMVNLSKRMLPDPAGIEPPTS